MRRRLLKGFFLGILLLMIPLLAAADENGNCGENLNWNLSNQGVLTISGTGAMKNFDYTSDRPPWQKYSSDLTSIIIDEDVSSVGNYAFDFNMPNLASISLPSTLTTIGSYAFTNLPNLCSIEYNGTESDWDSKVTKKDGNSALAVDKIQFAACTSHAFGDWTQTSEPTCTDAGVETRCCSRCNTTETRPVTALGHNMTKTDSKAATCTEDGNPEYWTCSRCSKRFHDHQGSVEFSDQESIVISALGHDFGEWTRTTEPTCTNTGVETRECSRCHATETRSVEALNHIFSEWTQTTAPTCTETGEKTRECTRCHVTETQSVAALGHNIIHYEAQAATCLTDGWDAYDACTRQDCDYSTKAVIPALNHDFSEWTQTSDPTCTAAGEKNRHCSRCDFYEVQPIAALGHSSVYHEAVSADCLTDGNIEYWTCSRCSGFFSDFACSIPITAEATVTGKLGHDFRNWTVTTPATCLTDGIETATCSRCTAANTRSVKKLGHNPVHHEAVSAQCLTDGNIEYWTCSRCSGIFSDSFCKTSISVDETVIQQQGHDFGEWTQTTEPTCTEEGENTRYCSRCDASETQPVNALGHHLENHEGKAATCTDIGWTAYKTCSRCNYSTYQEIPPKGHSPYEAVEESFVPPTCTAAGSVYDVIYCSSCKEELSRSFRVIDALGHEEEIVEAVAPTCKMTGLTEGKRCSRCKEILTAQTVVERLAHTPGNPVCENNIPATCNTSGRYDEVTYCTVCGYEMNRKQIITAPAHTYSNPIYIWSGDNLVCTATKICIVCSASDSQINIVSDHVDFRVDQSPTSQDTGTALCHAVFNDDSLSAYKNITIPALNNMAVLNLPPGLEIIGEEAFAGIVSEAVIIPDNCREIGPNAFADCANLRYVYIPKSVIRIADNAFDGCAKVILDIEQE